MQRVESSDVSEERALVQKAADTIVSLIWIIDRSLISRRAVQSPLSVKSGLQRANILPPRVNEMWQRVLVIQFDYLFTLPLQLQMDIFTHATFITRCCSKGERERVLKAKRGSAWIKQQLEFLLSSLQLHLSPARAALISKSPMCVVRV